MNIEELQNQTGARDNACSCTKCQRMCRNTPCLGTPQEILNIINNGYADKLAPTLWATGTLHGLPMINMVQARFDYDRHACSFLSEDNRCILHDAGLKPSEGRLATCKPEVYRSFTDTPVYLIASSWQKKENLSIIKKILKVIA